MLVQLISQSNLFEFQKKKSNIYSKSKILSYSTIQKWKNTYFDNKIDIII